jgi:uncharacterized protein YbjT (DUF2867 family)
VGEQRVLLVGATGMVGGCALRLCLDHPDVAKVTVIGRRSTGIDHSKLTEFVHDDFLDFSGIAEVFARHDVALFCLGTYTGAVADEEFRKITVDTTIAFASTLRERSPQAAFCFLSGQGADPSERSRIAFARYKGAAENAVLGLGFPRVHIFRPGYIYPVVPREEPNTMYRISRVLWPVLRRIYPNIGVTSEDLARAMVHAGLRGTAGYGSPVLENRDIRVLAANPA